MFDYRTNRTPIERLGSIGFHWFLVRFRSIDYAGRPASEQDKFLSGVKSDRFVNLHAMFWREKSIKKIWSLCLVGVFQSEARPILLLWKWISNQEL